MSSVVGVTHTYDHPHFNGRFSVTNLKLLQFFQVLEHLLQMGVTLRYSALIEFKVWVLIGIYNRLIVDIVN